MAIEALAQAEDDLNLARAKADLPPAEKSFYLKEQFEMALAAATPPAVPATKYQWGPLTPAHAGDAGDYAQAARAIAETLTGLAEIEDEVRALNDHLSPDAAAIDIEAFRGCRATLGETVVLPSVTSCDPDFWPTRPRSQRLMINEIYAKN